MNPIKGMRSTSQNLFEGLPATADALHECNLAAAKLVREAANTLHTARRTSATATFAHADRLTQLAARPARRRRRSCPCPVHCHDCGASGRAQSGPHTSTALVLQQRIVS